MVEKIKDSNLIWRGKTPVATQFDDVYYSADNGLEETRFVFLAGIDAPDIWQDREHFVIAETGFGTGLNFLATWKLWQDSGATGTLTFISTEAFPLIEADLEQAHAAFSELDTLSHELRAAWPPPSPGQHYRTFSGGKVRLLLLFGLAGKTLPQLNARVDAWFLDGFAPAKNPAMWSDKILDEITRLSHAGTRFATFTAAGFVKRGLQGRGFDVQKTPGYGRKRERLVGHMPLSAASTTNHHVPWHEIPPSPKKPESCLIIGGGIAGSAMAYALSTRGIRTQVLTNKPQNNSVPLAILAPGFQRTHQAGNLFAQAAYAHALSYAPYAHAWCEKHGLTSSDTGEDGIHKKHALADFLDWPEKWLKKTDQGYFLSASGSLNTEKAIQTLQENVTVSQATAQSLRYDNGLWHVVTDGETFTADIVVIANSNDSTRLLGCEDYLPMRSKAGQCELYRAGTSGLHTDNHAFKSGYLTAPSNLDGTRLQAIGSTFEDQEKVSQSQINASHTEIKQNYETALRGALDASGHVSSWRGTRATMPDHLPIVGPIPKWKEATVQFARLATDAKTKGVGAMPCEDGLYIIAGFGSKGFQQAPLAAEYLASLICDPFRILGSDMTRALHPGRFLIRSIVRSQP